jgi:transcriptional regulator with XRE-family HTH domain
MTHNTAPATAPPRRGGKWVAGAKLRSAREDAGLSQGRLGDLVGTTQQTIGHYEAEDDGWGPDLEMTVLLALALKRAPADLMHDEGREAFGKLAAALKAA